MGLSIHYRGGINHITDIPVLEDIANSMGWASRRFNIDENNPNFRGILIKPNGDCEPLWFLFDLEGKLRSLLGLITEHMDPQNPATRSQPRLISPASRPMPGSLAYSAIYKSTTSAI